MRVSLIHHLRTQILIRFDKNKSFYFRMFGEIVVIKRNGADGAIFCLNIRNCLLGRYTKDFLAYKNVPGPINVC
jgi:hypothetical protein